MCGIAAIVSSSLSVKERKVFKELMIVTQLRGPHATGVIRLERPTHQAGVPIAQQKKGLIYGHMKEAVHSSDAFHYGDFEEYCNGAKNHSVKALIGHCRHATVGDITDENSHPFNAEKVIGVHNGTITGTFTGSNVYETDSEAFYELLSRNDGDIEKTINDVNESATNMAYAFVWLDKTNSKLRFVRNAQRPLWFAKIPGTWLVSSEKEMLQLVCARNKIHITELKPLPVGECWSIKPGLGQDIDVQKLELKQKEWSSTRGRYWPAYSSSTSSSGSSTKKIGTGKMVYYRDKNAVPSFIGVSIRTVNSTSPVTAIKRTVNYHVKKEEEKTPKENQQTDKGSSSKGGGNILIPFSTGSDEAPDVEMYVRGPSGYCEVEQYKELVKEGCGCCGETPTVDDAPNLEWYGTVGNRWFFCNDCKDTYSRYGDYFDPQTALN